MTTPEGAIQKYGQEQLKKRGCLVRKISYEMRRGCPDQLVLVPIRQYATTKEGWAIMREADVVFIEYKKDENTEPEPHQLREHERMRAAGADVRIIGSKAEVDALIEELFPA
jgi:succinate dehydrogenase flavin-adding protein (antitoxin of CptAB toxin-antitoxin module)